ncbi:WGR domain-containing protein [Phyllobacterium chamaecytisi]|uniref:WGR domain-containing protein n=1 Tax=Phyllobacterium chamaecytisi TaxID=2876082 RepID=UPI00351DA567
MNYCWLSIKTICRRYQAVPNHDKRWTLFSEACLIRLWGRIGTRRQEKLHHFEREEGAVGLFLDLSTRSAPEAII